MGLIDLKTDLKSITYSSVNSRGPYVSKPIPGNNQQGSTTTEISARRDDLSRFVKMLGDRPGLQFLANQTLLTQADSAREFKKAREGYTTESGKKVEGKTIFGALLKTTGKSLLGTAKTTASILAQVPVNGTGTHFIIGLGGNEYLQSGLGAQTGLGRFFRSIGIGGGVNGAARALQGKTIILDYEGQGEFSFPVNDTLEYKDSKFKLKEDYQPHPKTPDPVFKKEYTVEDVNTGEDVNYALNSKSIIVGYNPGKRGKSEEQLKDKTLSIEIDQLNSKEIIDLTAEINNSTVQDIIPFRFNVYTPKNQKGYDLYFRAFLTNFSDSYNGEWSGTKYIGRAEDMYTYQGFKRDLNLNFNIAAFSRGELNPLYNKLNALVGSTAPTYAGVGSFMRGTLTSLTIGDYVINLDGFINSIQLSWNTAYSWEIDFEDKNDINRVPHVLDVSLSFTPIHKFNAQFNTGKFIGEPAGGVEVGLLEDGNPYNL